MTTTVLTKLIKKDMINRFNYLLLEIEYNILKGIASNKILPLNLRIKAFHKLNFLKSTKIRNICILSGRPRAIIKKFGVSRFWFRNLADNGYIYGLKRASW